MSAFVEEKVETPGSSRRSTLGFGSPPSTVVGSVGYEHRSLENPLGSLENLPARRALVLEMLEKNFARFSLGSVCARKKLRSSSLGSNFLCSKCSKWARYVTQKINYPWWTFYSLLWVLLQNSPWPSLFKMNILSTISDFTEHFSTFHTQSITQGWTYIFRRNWTEHYLN